MKPTNLPTISRAMLQLIFDSVMASADKHSYDGICIPDGNRRANAIDDAIKSLKNTIQVVGDWRTLTQNDTSDLDGSESMRDATVIRIRVEPFISVNGSEFCRYVTWTLIGDQKMVTVKNHNGAKLIIPMQYLEIEDQ